ncbi:hypothetical protein ABMA27_015659 [Loxostege sticticalis]|uniref:Palmitoyltransferase n=1 Tax=Loxostege sticticalis TaxID=481309 RepID=A0ABR3I8E5_LOXSC
MTMKICPRRISWIYLFEKVLCFIIVFLVNPCYFIFHMTFIRNNLVALYNPEPVQYWFHFFMSWFCFINVTGNIFMAIFTDTSLKKNFSSRYGFDGGTYCGICKKFRPPKSWHCRKCNVCILRRNHHCFFISRCIGINNQRYFLLYLAYILISLVYSTYHDFFVVASKFERTVDMLVSMIFPFNPVTRSMVLRSCKVPALYALFLALNVALIIWLLFVIYYHWQNAIRGVTPHERLSLERKKLSDAHNTDQIDRNEDTSNWKENMLRIFGTRWYLAILIPFVDSPFPEEGRKSGQWKLA